MFSKHLCLENINKLYKYAGKCDDQNQYKAIMEATMVSITERITDNIKIAVGMLGTTKKPTARNPISQFWALLDVKQKTDVSIMGAAKKSAGLSKQAVSYGTAFII